MLVIGITGSIGMGKSTISNLFLKEGYPVYNADNIISYLLKKKNIIKKIKYLLPEVVNHLYIDKNKLSKIIFTQPNILKMLENILYPLLWKKKYDFLLKQYQKGFDISILDIPLLYEKNIQSICNYVIVVDAPYAIALKRTLKRSNMTSKKLYSILDNQIPNKKKCLYADFIIESNKNINLLHNDVKHIINNILYNIKK